jgi:hypothetical protein
MFWFGWILLGVWVLVAWARFSGEYDVRALKAVWHAFLYGVYPLVGLVWLLGIIEEFGKCRCDYDRTEDKTICRYNRDGDCECGAYRESTRQNVIGNVFFKLMLLLIGQLNVPLSQFFIENVFVAEFSGSVLGMCLFAMIAIQVLGMNVFYFFTVFAGNDKPKLVDGNTEIYKDGFKGWIFIEMWYDLLSALFVALAQRYQMNIYWAAVALHLAYTAGHLFFQPSLYSFHNWLEGSIGVSHLLEDIGVLEFIYGSGRMNRSGWWTIICIFIPIATSILKGIYGCYRSCDTKSDSNMCDWVQVKLDPDDGEITALLYLLTLGTCCGAAVLDFTIPTEAELPWKVGAKAPWQFGLDSVLLFGVILFTILPQIISRFCPREAVKIHSVY